MIGDTTLSATGYPVSNDNHSKQETPESTGWSNPLIKVEITGRKRFNPMDYFEPGDVGVNTRQAVGKPAGRPLFTVTFWMPDSLCDGTHLAGLSPSYQAPTVHNPRNNLKVTHFQRHTKSGKQSLVKASLRKQTDPVKGMSPLPLTVVS